MSFTFGYLFKLRLANGNTIADQTRLRLQIDGESDTNDDVLISPGNFWHLIVIRLDFRSSATFMSYLYYDVDPRSTSSQPIPKELSRDVLDQNNLITDFIVGANPDISLPFKGTIRNVFFA